MQPLYEYVCHIKGHRNSKGELAEWVIKSHETGEILSSHKSEPKAKEHLQQMHIFNEAAEGEEYCSHCGANVAGIEEYNGRKLCPSCLTQFKWLDEHRDPEDGTYETYDLVPRESEDDEPDENEKEEFHSLLYDMANGHVNDINKFLQKYDISIELLDRETVESEELFDEDSQDLAMAFASLRDDPKVMPIGLNESLIYYYYVEQFNGRYTLFDEFMSDTLWHEAGHAICRWVEDMLDLLDATYIDDEEALVENFGFYMTSKTMHIDKDVSRKLLSKFNGAFAVMDAYNKGCYDDAAFRKMLNFFSPNLDSEKLADILETHGIHKKQSASSIQDKKSDTLLGEASERKKEIPVIVCADMGMGKTTFVKKINDSGKYKCYDLEVCDLPNIWGEPDEDGNMALVDGWEDIALNKIKSLDADVVAITSDPKMVHKLIESGIPFFLAYKDDISAIRKDIEKRTSEHFANVVKDFWKYIEKSDIPEELKEQMKECDPEAMTNVKCADALPPSIIETDKFQSDDRYRHWHDMFKLKTGGKAVSIMDRNIENLESRLKEFDKITSNLCTKLRLNAGEYLSSPSILHKILDRVDEKEKKSDKLLGESTDGTDMDNRVKIFMEGVSQLGLSPKQVEAIDNITKVCLESKMFGNPEDDDNVNPENDYNPENDDSYNPENDIPENDYNPENDEISGDEDNAEYAHELTMDEMYDKLVEQGVSKQTINIVTDIIGWNPDSMLKILDAATGYKSFDQLPEF